MPRVQVNLVKDGVQYTVSDDTSADGIGVAEFTADFASEIGILVESGGFSLPTAPAPMPVGGPAPTGGQIFKPIVQIRVLPEGEGKCSVEFYGDTFKQPIDDYFTVKAVKWTTARLVGLFKPLKPAITEDFFEKAGKYKFECNVGYTLSDKKNSAGNPYKDIQSLQGEVTQSAPEQEPEQQMEEPDDIPF